MHCHTCRCELTQAEVNRAADILPGAGPLCFECADWLDIESRTDETLTIYPEGNDTAPLRLELPHNPK